MRIWGHQNWSGVGARSDGTPTYEVETPWLTTGLFRGQPSWVPEGRDLRARLEETCVSSCVDGVGTVSMAVHLENYGPWEAPVGTPIALYTSDADGAWTLERTLSLSEALPAYTATGAFPVDLPIERARFGVRVVAGDFGDGVLPEDDCVPEDNTLEWRPDACTP